METFCGNLGDGKYPFNKDHIRVLGVLIRIIGAHLDPEIRDQLWILDRVYQKNPNKNFFYCDFGCVVALSYLIGKFGQSGNK